MKKTKLDLVKSWLKKAERDFKVAQRELFPDEPFSDIVCFHAQQAVEKYLKHDFRVFQFYDQPKLNKNQFTHQTV